MGHDARTSHGHLARRCPPGTMKIPSPLSRRLFEPESSRRCRSRPGPVEGPETDAPTGRPQGGRSQRKQCGLAGAVGAEDDRAAIWHLPGEAGKDR